LENTTLSKIYKSGGEQYKYKSIKQKQTKELWKCFREWERKKVIKRQNLSTCLTKAEGFLKW